MTLLLQAVKGCVECGTLRRLEFDVIHPVGNSDHHRKMNPSQRMTFYWRQYEANNLTLRCKSHNSRKKDRLVLVDHPAPPEIPF